jgi:hypothetical protein
MLRRLALGAVIVTALAVHTSAHAEKLPTDEGLRVTLTPSVTKMKVGQVVEFTMRWTDDDAVSVESDLFVEANGGSGMAGDGFCETPLQRNPNEGGAAARATFKKPGKYVVRASVTTSACHGQVTGMGTEKVVVTRTITVVR